MGPRAGAIGGWLATSNVFRPFRDSMQFSCLRNLSSSEVDDGAVAASMDNCRDRCLKTIEAGYEVVSFEIGRERVKRRHIFRLHSFVTLKLRHHSLKEAHYVRLDWSSEGLRWRGPSVDEESLTCKSGVLYPYLRRYDDVPDPQAAWARLDADVFAPMLEHETRYDWGRFNSGHFAELVRKALLMPMDDCSHTVSHIRSCETLHSEMVLSHRVVAPDLEHLDPVNAQGERMTAWCRKARHETKEGKPLPGRLVEQVPREALLGEGAFGRVWRAVDQRTGETFAVKTLPAKESGSELEAFERLQSISHPCIVGLLHMQHFQDVQLCAIVMELCAGGTLLKKIKQATLRAREPGNSYLPPVRAAKWIGQIFLGLEYLHTSANVVLRDVKPENVLICGQSRAKLADFGLCVVAEPGTSFFRTRTVGGTAGYAAPELLAGEDVCPKADLYSFGALVWVVSTGGVLGSKKPQPPAKAGAGLRGLRDDWRLLQAHLAGQSENLAPAIGGMAHALVKGLITQQPSERMGHEAIRSSAYMRAIAIPEPGVDNDGLNQWIETRGACEEPTGELWRSKSLMDMVSWSTALLMH